MHHRFVANTAKQKMSFPFHKNILSQTKKRATARFFILKKPLSIARHHDKIFL